MTDTTHSPSPDAFNLKQALKDAGFAGMVTFGLCVPIVAFRAEQDMANKLVLQQRWWMALVITGLVVAFAATALALVLTLRLHQTTGAVTLAEDPEANTPPPEPGASVE